MRPANARDVAFTTRGLIDLAPNKFVAELIEGCIALRCQALKMPPSAIS